jgi:hypothetical protein
MNRKIQCLSILILGAFFCSISDVGCKKEEAKIVTTTQHLKAMIARYAESPITADTASLHPGDRKALRKLIEAGKVMDQLFLQQAWSGNPALFSKLKADTSEEGRLKLRYFMINYVPWSSLDNDSAFIEGVPVARPTGANFYPEDMTKDEFGTWINGLSPREQDNGKGFFTLIRRDETRALKIVSYAQEYAEGLTKAAALLREAAMISENSSLKNFLSKRADAFLSNDYYASDAAWMDVDAPIDVTIGPYETYKDKLFGYKATFEAYVTLRDDHETDKLKKFSSFLQELENNLPIDPKYRNPKLGTSAPIRVVDELFAGGDTKGVQTAAFNLPNDEKFVREKGSKRVMLKNVQEAKFNQILVPISKVVLDADQQGDVKFEPFFTHILAHELMHGLGPHNIILDGKPATVRASLQELYSAIEEAKADITGLWALQYLIDKGLVDKSMEQTMYKTFLASAFRSVRFGIREAHGKGIAVQFNYLMDEGAIVYRTETSTFRVRIDLMKDAVRKLTREILTLQAEGNKQKARAMLGEFGVIRAEMKKGLDKLTDVPIDIAPIYPLAQ